MEHTFFPVPPVGRADPSVGWENKQNSLPIDAYQRGYWMSTPTYPAFVAPPNPLYGDVTNVVSRLFWQSAIFDFRSDLKGSMGPTPAAVGVRGGQTFGGESITLAVQITNLAQLAGQFNAYSVEYAHLTNPALLVQAGLRQDISADLFDGMGTLGAPIDCQILTFSPPNGVRYWRVVVVVDYISGVAPLPLLFDATCW